MFLEGKMDSIIIIIIIIIITPDDGRIVGIHSFDFIYRVARSRLTHFKRS